MNDDGLVGLLAEQLIADRHQGDVCHYCQQPILRHHTRGLRVVRPWRSGLAHQACWNDMQFIVRLRRMLLMLAIVAALIAVIAFRLS